MIAQCPICENRSYTHSFPFETFWNKKIFQYLKCKNCKCTYVHPLPTDKDFEKMYNKEAYHDVHYKNNDINNYKRSLSFLSQFSNNKKTLLDYGCGDKQLEKMYNRLLANCDKAIDNSTDAWALNFWKQTKEKLYVNMSELGILKNNKTIH